MTNWLASKRNPSNHIDDCYKGFLALRIVQHWLQTFCTKNVPVFANVISCMMTLHIVHSIQSILQTAVQPNLRLVVVLLYHDWLPVTECSSSILILFLAAGKCVCDVTRLHPEWWDAKQTGIATKGYIRLLRENMSSGICKMGSGAVEIRVYKPIV